MHELEKQMVDLRMVNARLIEDNDSFQLLLGEKTLNGTLSRGDFLRPSSSHSDRAPSRNGPLNSLADELGDDLEQILQLFALAFDQVVVRQEVQRDHLDPEVVAPAQELVHLGCARAMPVRGTVVTELARPPAIAVDHHRHVVGHGRRHAAAQARDVETVERAPPLVLPHARHPPTLPRHGRRHGSETGDASWGNGERIAHVPPGAWGPT